MKALLLSHSDIDGGAARATYRLHQGLQKVGVNSQMLVEKKSSDDKKVIAPLGNLEQSISKLRISVDVLPLKLYKTTQQKHASIFSLQWLPDKITPQISQLQPDIINIHWVNKAFFQIETLPKLNRPLIWTLHDMWAFTGGCHYSGDCNRYINSCGACPQLGSNTNLDLSRWVWGRKVKARKNLDLTIVTPSTWLAKCASFSSLFKDLRVEQIPYGLDIQKYRPVNKQMAREVLNLPQDKQLVLFGAVHATSDKRKGFHLLQSALQELSQFGLQDKLELVIFGASQPEKVPDFGFKTYYLGTLNDDLSLALLYSAADVFVLPSIEDNLPNTVLEAIACGTPSVAFSIGGMPDMIEHQQNGYLAQPFKIEELASGISWILEDKERHHKLSFRAREKAEQEFALEIQASRYSSLFEEVLTRSKSRNL